MSGSPLFFPLLQVRRNNFVGTAEKEPVIIDLPYPQWYNYEE